MNTHAAGTFVIESWDEQPYEEHDGTRLTRMRLAKRFSGDVEGESAAKRLMAYGSEEGSAAYVGLERVTDNVHGRSGSFVLRHSAAMERGEGKSSLAWYPTRERASCVACAARPESPSSPAANTPSRSTTTSSNESTTGTAPASAFVDRFISATL
jgi:hypothetical protein